jgi:hypothetical protein
MAAAERWLLKAGDCQNRFDLSVKDFTWFWRGVAGLKEINVTSADEAYKLLTIGQRNLKTACTRLNHCSSRRFDTFHFGFKFFCVSYLFYFIYLFIFKFLL